MVKLGIVMQEAQIVILMAAILPAVVIVALTVLRSVSPTVVPQILIVVVTIYSTDSNERKMYYKFWTKHYERNPFGSFFYSRRYYASGYSYPVPGNLYDRPKLRFADKTRFLRYCALPIKAHKLYHNKAR
jgi:hypothetical protein